MSLWLSGRVSAFCARGPGFDPSIVTALLSYYYLLQLQHLLSALLEALINCCKFRATFFPCGQSTFMQCSTVALHKRLLSAPVHAGLVSIINRVGGEQKQYPFRPHRFSLECIISPRFPQILRKFKQSCTEIFAFNRLNSKCLLRH